MHKLEKKQNDRKNNNQTKAAATVYAESDFVSIH